MRNFIVVVNILALTLPFLVSQFHLNCIGKMLNTFYLRILVICISKYRLFKEHHSWLLV